MQHVNTVAACPRDHHAFHCLFHLFFATPLSFSRFRGLVSELHPGQEHLAILKFVMNFTTVCCAWIEVMLTTSLTCNEKLTTIYKLHQTDFFVLFCFCVQKVLSSLCIHFSTVLCNISLPKFF